MLLTIRVFGLRNSICGLDLAGRSQSSDSSCRLCPRMPSILAAEDHHPPPFVQFIREEGGGRVHLPLIICEIYFVRHALHSRFSKRSRFTSVTESVFLEEIEDIIRMACHPLISVRIVAA
jgi:hypothetical protein